MVLNWTVCASLLFCAFDWAWRRDCWTVSLAALARWVREKPSQPGAAIANKIPAITRTISSSIIVNPAVLFALIELRHILDLIPAMIPSIHSTG